MDIGGPYPFRVVGAYQPADQVGHAGNSLPAVSVPAPSTRSAREASSLNIGRLVAARVPGGMEFDTSAMTPIRSSGAYQMYTRAADRLEAATGVQCGRVIDLKA